MSIVFEVFVLPHNKNKMKTSKDKQKLILATPKAKKRFG